MDIALLTLSVSPALEEELIDWFLKNQYPGFTMWKAFGVGASIQSLSLAEQVAGRQKRMIFKLHGQPEDLKECLKKLKMDYPNSDIHFWLHPLIDAGNISAL